VNLFEVVRVGRTAAKGSRHAEVVAIQLDRDVLGRVLLHVQNLKFEEN